MKGKNYTIPFGMIFKKYCCSKCGEKLEKEKTHRVVTEDDKDYYQYHDYRKFPRDDIDVYDHRWKCPSCGARISFDEQCIIERIQKKCGQSVLSRDDIKEFYTECKEKNAKRVLLRNICVAVIACFVSVLLSVFTKNNRTSRDYLSAFLLFAVIATASVIACIKRHKGKYKSKRNYAYSYEKESQFKKLHAYSSYNKDLIKTADKCYCFYCKSIIAKDDIKNYADNGQTALCPKCEIDAIIPDSIEDTVDQQIISEMNEYWF